MNVGLTEHRYIGDRIEQALRLFVKGVFERKGIEKNLWAKKFIKNILYSKEEIALTLYYKNASEKEFSLSTASGRVGAATGRDAFLDLDKKISLTGICKANDEDWLLASRSAKTIDIILPNIIHGCKKKNL